MEFFSEKTGSVSAILFTVLFLIFSYLNKDSQSVKKATKPTPELVKNITPEPTSVDNEPEVSLNDSSAGQLHTDRVTARVVKVSDGDTIEVDFGGGVIKTVRYIGIDTPETVDPRKPVQCFGKEASNINKSLVGNQIVQLEKDISETDKYGRLLRYVYLPSGQAGAGEVFVNKYLVEEGFAHSYSYPPDIRHQGEFNQAEASARQNNKGLWGTCDVLSGKSQAVGSGTSKDDKDCSDFKTHQEAQDYFNSKGGSGTNNVDKLDGSDRDGQVCETLP